MGTSTLPAQVDFADVYATNLDAVWRFVRARIWDHHEAQDVTSDVFLRAWRSWDRYDPERGPVEPWLFTIAHRTVTDRLRRRAPDEPVDASASEAAPTLSPEQEVLRDELLAQLAHAIGGLRPEAQDGLALRFAARLSTDHIAAVLGTSTSAAKMLLHRAIHQLADEVEAPAPPTQEPADLEVIIDDVLARGHATMDTSALHGLLVHLTALQSPPTPDELPHEVARCIECAATEEVTDDGRAADPRARGRQASSSAALTGGGAAALLSFMGVCLVCTVPALATVFTALGIMGAGFAIHYVGLAAVPLVLWLIHRGGRRHGHDRGYRWARAGAGIMGVHAILHVINEIVATLPDWAWTVFTITDWVGTPLLVLGAGLNLVDMHRWRRRQAQGLHQLLAT